MDRLRPEDALTRFVFERTRPKQVGPTVMTAGITQSFLDALNNGAVPTITSSWQSVEETECQRALEYATEVYKSSFDSTKPPEEATIREAHEVAVQKALSAFNSTAVGAGSARQRYEIRLHTLMKKELEDYKREAFMKAYMQCINAIQKMEKDLRAACQAPSAKFDDILKVLDQLLSSYEATSYGPEKWQKLASFLRQSLEGPILDFGKKQIDHISSEKSSLRLKCRSIEDKMGLLTNQLEASEKYKSDYLKRYEDAIDDKNKLREEYMNQIADLKKNSSSLDERCSSLSKTLEAAKQESMEWKRKYEVALNKQKAGEEHASSEVANLKARSSAAEARLAAAQKQTLSAQEEADEWKRKYDIAVREAKTALEKAAAVQDRASKQTQHREDALRSKFAGTLAGKEAEIKDKESKIEQAEQRVTTLSLELKCDFVREIWKQFRQHMHQLQDLERLQDVVKILSRDRGTNKLETVVNKLIVAAAVYHIWQERNARFFKNQQRNKDVIYQTIRDNVRHKLMTIRVRNTRNVERIADMWELSWSGNNLKAK